MRTAILLAGPTAVGKSAVALRLAERLDGEIVSVDSMQVYRGLDLGTAKPAAEERRRVPHHLIDVVDLTEPFDAARFVTLARAAVTNIQARGRRPILCGGTGFYFKAYLDGLEKAPAADPKLRAELERRSLSELVRELSERDPAGLQRLDQRNPRRLVRALEVIRLTGRPLPLPRSGPCLDATAAPSPMVVALSRASEDLRHRIEVRVEAMFAHGLVAETEQLLRRGLRENRTAMQAIGYRQVVEHLRGDRPLAETVALVKQKTWQFARRQRTWLRHQLPVSWIEVGAATTAEETAEAVIGVTDGT